MSFKWTQGSPERMIATIQHSEQNFTDTAIKIVTESVDDGQQLQRKILDEAETAYGRERYSRGQGNSPGRNDSGHMIKEVHKGVEVDGNTVRGYWGWDTPEGYFFAQDETAQSLWGSFIPTREAFFRRFIAATRGF